MLNTTLNEIKKHRPCIGGWRKLLHHLGKTEADDESLNIMTILEANGIEDAVWCLRAFKYRDYCLFNADVAESVLSIFEAKYPKDARPRNAIKTIRDYKAGKITKEELGPDAACDAYDAAAAYDDAAAAYDAAYDAAYAAYAAYNAYNAYAAAYAAAYTASASAYTAYTASAYAAAATSADKWAGIETIFTKHFKH